MIGRQHVPEHGRGLLLFASMVIANLADLDFVPGLLLGDLRLFHHQATHSLGAVAIVALVIGVIARSRGSGIGWALWGGGVYLSHVVLDMLIEDPSPPYGVQLLWPLSQSYFISPFTLFARFDYFAPDGRILETVFSLHNLGTVLQEIGMLFPLVLLAWYVGMSRMNGSLKGRPEHSLLGTGSTPTDDSSWRKRES